MQNGDMTDENDAANGSPRTFIERVHIRNYRIFREFEVPLGPGLNVVVGDNDSGKSTLLEAIGLALTGRVGRNRLNYEMSPHLFNQAAATEFVTAINAGEIATPPEITIDLYLSETPDTVKFIGANNMKCERAPGLSVHVAFDNEFQHEYDAHVAEKNLSMVPSEYYKVEWRGFSGDALTARGVKIATSTIDASTIWLQSGVDYYLQKIIQDRLSEKERAEIARASRRQLAISRPGSTDLKRLQTSWLGATSPDSLTFLSTGTVI